MKKELKLSPSILAADFSILGEQISKAEKGGAKYLHLDVMDSRFVPNFSFGAVVIKPLRKATSLVFDCHLMVERPYDFIEACVKAGADIVTIHYEAAGEKCKEMLSYIRSLNVKAGLSISPDTPVEVLEEFLEYTDMILIMSVYPGFGGQKFMEKSLDRLAAVHKMTEGYDIDIEVDGGVNLKNVSEIVKAGANVIVAGSAVFGADDIEAATRNIIKNAEGGMQ